MKYSSLKSDRPVNATASANWRESAHTRKWSEAQRQATDWLQSFHPDKVELRAKDQELARLNGKTATVPTVQMAVGLYIADLRFRQLAEKTIGSAKTLLGDADPNTGEVKQTGKLFPWLEEQKHSKASSCFGYHSRDADTVAINMARGRFDQSD